MRFYYFFTVTALLQLPAGGLFAAGDEAAIDAVLPQQLLMRAALDDLPLIHHDDLVGMADGFGPVGAIMITVFSRVSSDIASISSFSFSGSTFAVASSRMVT